MSTNDEMERLVAGYVADIQRMHDKHAAEHGNEIPAPRIEAERNRRYYRIIIVRQQTNSRSVHSFVEIETGNILMAAGWKAPAPGVRGNVRKLGRGYGADSAWSYR